MYPIRTRMKQPMSLGLIALLAACGGSVNDNDQDEPGEPEPLAITINADRETVAPGEIISLTSTVSGDAADGSNVAWSAPAGAFSTTSGESTDWTAPAAPGTFTITAELSAGADTVSDSVTIEVTRAPVTPLAISVTAPTDSAIYGQVITLEADVTGDGAGSATVNWTAEPDLGDFSAATGRATVWSAPSATGTVTITAAIDGEPISDSVSIEVELCSSGSVDDGTEPCLIQNVHQLQAIGDHLAGHFVLSGDIDAAVTEDWNDGAGFLPINGSFGFTGSLDGDGNSIRNLHIFDPDSENVGLFGWLGQDAAITDLDLEDADIHGQNRVGALVGTSDGVIVNASSSGAVTGTDEDVGGLIGYNRGEVSDSSSTAIVSGTFRVGGLVGGNTGSIDASWSINGNASEPGVSASEGSAGGLVGVSWGAIADSFSGSHIDSQGANAGGLVGNNVSNTGRGFIDRSYSSRTAIVKGTWNVGGLAGNNFGHINQSYSLAGSVEGTNQVGGLVGHHRTLASASPPDGTIRESYSMSQVRGTSEVGGLVGESEPNPDVTVLNSFWDIQRSGQLDSAGGTGLDTVNMLQQSTFSGWDFDNVWFINEGAGSPDLRSNPRR